MVPLYHMGNMCCLSLFLLVVLLYGLLYLLDYLCDDGKEAEKHHHGL